MQWSMYLSIIARVVQYSLNSMHLSGHQIITNMQMNFSMVGYESWDKEGVLAMKMIRVLDSATVTLMMIRGWLVGFDVCFSFSRLDSL